MYTYASSYISGFEKVIETILKSQIKDVVIVKHLDGLIVYKTKLEFSRLQMSCFNNTYQVLAMSPTDMKLAYDDALRKFASKIELNLTGIADNVNLAKYKFFKILPFDGNTPTAINFDIVRNLENQIKQGLNLKVEFKKHDLDVVLLRRREGWLFVLFKLTYNRITEKKLDKGALRPELCNIMAWIADLRSTDIIIDPFCGYGSIPKEIIKHFDYNMMFASDADAGLIEKLKNEFKKNKKNLFIKQRDALNLEYFETGFFDRIVTDPPWNLYNSQNGDFSVFYDKMLKEFQRILKPEGIGVILMGNVQDFEKALAGKKFELTEKYHILVNGKKANVYKIVRI